LIDLKSVYRKLFDFDLYDHVEALASVNTKLSQERNSNWWKKWWKNKSTTLIDVLIYVKGLQALVDLSQWCHNSNCQITDKLEKLTSDLKTRENRNSEVDKTKPTNKKQNKFQFSSVKETLKNLMSYKGKTLI